MKRCIFSQVYMLMFQETIQLMRYNVMTGDSVPFYSVLCRKVVSAIKWKIHQINVKLSSVLIVVTLSSVLAPMSLARSLLILHVCKNIPPSQPAIVGRP